VCEELITGHFVAFPSECELKTFIALGVLLFNTRVLFPSAHPADREYDDFAGFFLRHHKILTFKNEPSS